MLNRTRTAVLLTTLSSLSWLFWPAQPDSLEARGMAPAILCAPEDDGRVATVVDSQGVAMVRPVARERWTPLRQRGLLMPGDQVRTSARGANALALQLVSGGQLIVGPGTLIELTEKGKVRLYRGELSVEAFREPAPAEGANAEVKKAAAAERPTIEVAGPGGFTKKVTGTWVGRVEARKTKTLTSDPRWLSGYRESTTDEWVGSLIAKIDGRDVALSVGYHKVDVVINDQIAQTTVEQSFINSTKFRTEGVFYFPLPADASISGFGMWIGGELVEADIVEKQRARQIYEDILRRKRDPGLLEWSGGNLFKARVFPIEAHSEKRIRIRYTQVLPVEGTKLRYRYALRSELLRQRPLRELGIKVSVVSATKITDAASSTHEVRVRKTDHVATFEFDAQEYTPERDFEVAIDLDRSKAITVVSHRRVSDGYYMLMVAPPSAASGAWQRDLMPEGKPVDVILVADTSASMDKASRESQADFIQSLLSMLGEKDRFRLMTVDVRVANFAVDPVSVSEKSIESAMAFLGKQSSMGWTDLDVAMAQVGQFAEEETVVIYVGDGIGTTGDADPVALARRIRRSGKKGVFHAVSTGSTYEQGVLESLASLGGGSVREVAEDAAGTAYSLLAEAAQPAIKNMQVEFRGLRTARVYPEVLPNLPLGKQQVLLGRYLPTDRNQKGTVIVRGELDGKPVRYTTDIEIVDGEVGNSFIPRLWARRHLDHLLAQGRSAQIKEDIVAFSEEFGIMTPFTSFLVLESDADRKRYGVQRRVRMRDGDKFFAKGRDKASTEVLRQQMRRAKTYRLQMRLAMLAEIDGLGRSLHGWNVAITESSRLRLGDTGGFGWGPSSGAYRGRRDLGRPSNLEGKSKAGEKLGARHGFESYDRDSAAEREESGAANEFAARAPNEQAEDVEMDALDLPVTKSADKKSKSRKIASNLAKEERARVGGGRFGRGLMGRGWKDGNIKADGLYSMSERLQRSKRPARPTAFSFHEFGFPALAGKYVEPKEPRLGKWSEDILALMASLDRRERIEKSELGFTFDANLTWVHPLQGRITNWSSWRGHYASRSWVTRHTSRDGQPRIEWSVGGVRGVVAESLRLGRSRAADRFDGRFKMGLADYSTRDFARSYADYTATLKERRDGKTQVVLTARAPRKLRYEFLVDRERRVVLQVRAVHEGRVTSTTDFSKVIEKGGMFFATRTEHRDAKHRLVWYRELKVATTTAAASAKQMNATVALTEQALMLGQKDPKIAAAKQALHEGKASIADHLRIVTHYAATQQWDKTWAAFAKVGSLVSSEVKPKAALPWLRLHLQAVSRRGEEFKTNLQRIVGDWRKAVGKGESTPAGIDFLAARGRSFARPLMSSSESLTLIESLEPVYRRETGDESARGEAATRYRDLVFRHARADLLRSNRRLDEELKLRRATKRRYGDEFYAVMNYVTALGRASASRQQATVIAAAVGEKSRWLESEISRFYDTWVNALFTSRDLEELQRVAKAWTAADPENFNAWSCMLSSDLFRNRGDDVRKFVTANLGDVDVRVRAQWAKTRAAIHRATGRGWRLGSANSIADRWHTPLANAVRRCLRMGTSRSMQLANEVLGMWYFRNTDAWPKLREGFLTDLLADDGIAKMSLSRMAVYMNWVPFGRNAIDRAKWEKVRDQLRARFAAAEVAGDQQVLGGYVLKVLDAWPEKVAALTFLREWRGVARIYPEQVSRLLFDRLLRTDWTQAIEDEAFGLVTALQPEKAEAGAREQICADAVRILANRLLTMRQKSSLGPVAELEKLRRKERREREAAARTKVRRALSTRFDKAVVGGNERQKRWYRLEQLCYAAESRSTAADRTVASAIELLGSAPGVGKDIEPFVYRLLRHRSSLLMAYAVTRSKDSTSAKAANTVLEAYAREGKERKKTLDWRYQTFRLLLALDRGDDLAAALRSWIVPEKADATWRRSLGYLMAERGKVADAVAAFEGVASADELSPEDYQALANWHLVLGDDARRDKARRRSLEVSSENELANRLYAAQSKVQRKGGGLSGVLTPDDLLAMDVLMSKSRYPQNYVWRIRNLYSRCKDFRALGCLPYGVVGHSSGSIYQFLRNTGRVIQQVHEEASCDSLSSSIGTIAASAERLTDRRGLLLLTAQVERRAAKVLNMPGGHVKKALAAMQGAFKGEWARGERQTMASYLASLGRIEHRSLADEQLRQLRRLFADADNATAQRLGIARSLAQVLWSYEDRDDAIDVLISALDDFKSLSKGVLSSSANHVVQTLASYLQQSGRFMQGETFLTAQRTLQTARTQKNWYTWQLYGVYVAALRAGGEVSIGKGGALFAQCRKQLLKMLWEGQADVLSRALNYFNSVHITAHQVGVAGARDRLVDFAEKDLPELLPRFLFDQGQRIVSIAQTMRSMHIPRQGYAVLVRSLEREPTWLRSVNREYWRNFAWTIGRLRSDGRSAALDQRLLPHALRELRIDLGRRNWRNSNLFHRHRTYFWSAAAGDFARTAVEFIAAHKTSTAKVIHAANYLWSGLTERDAAIAALENLDKAKLLHESGQWRLAGWYHEAHRYESAIPLLERLVAKRQDRLDYRMLLVRVQYKGGNHEASTKLLIATQKRWVEKRWWNENSMASVASTAFGTNHWQQAAEWYEAAVRENERSGRRRYNWRGTRSTYYGYMARAHGKLGHDDAAVDAASAAVVTWGPDRKNRRKALEALHKVVAGLSDLDAYVRRWDARVKKTGLDAPVIRKELGSVYLSRAKPRSAIVQLRLARELQPNDSETHQKLLTAYDNAGDRAGALAALVSSIEMSPMDLDLYQLLARRLSVAGDKAGAERAYTSMVEVKPNEAEPHRRLAQVRAKQKRHAEAVVQWRQVTRVRSDEPDGWLSLASAQIDAGQRTAADKTLDHVLAATWNPRFKLVKARARLLQTR